MSEPTPEQPTDPARPPVGLVPQEQIDDSLQLLAALAQQHEVELGLTLSVSGLIVTGTLIGRNKWTGLLEEKIAEAGENAAILGSSLRKWLDETVTKPEDDDDLAIESYGFLHLRDTRIFAGNGLVPTPPHGMLWRGRINHVSGWSIGNLAPPASS